MASHQHCSFKMLKHTEFTQGQCANFRGFAPSKLQQNWFQISPSFLQGKNREQNRLYDVAPAHSLCGFGLGSVQLPACHIARTWSCRFLNFRPHGWWCGTHGDRILLNTNNHKSKVWNIKTKTSFVWDFPASHLFLCVYPYFHREDFPTSNMGWFGALDLLGRNPPNAESERRQGFPLGIFPEHDSCFSLMWMEKQKYEKSTPPRMCIPSSPFTDKQPTSLVQDFSSDFLQVLISFGSTFCLHFFNVPFPRQKNPEG